MWRSSLLLGLLTGCPTDGVCVTVPDASPERFTVAIAQGRDCDETPLVTRVTISRAPRGEVLWNLTALEGIALSTLRYGELPSGFSQGIAAQPLSVGDTLNVEVEGRGSSGGVDVVVTGSR